MYDNGRATRFRGCRSSSLLGLVSSSAMILSAGGGRKGDGDGDGERSAGPNKEDGESNNSEGIITFRVAKLSHYRCATIAITVKAIKRALLEQTEKGVEIISQTSSGHF